ncbi:MAG: hypothetical protein HY921_04380 [Elusimicrobia bacterium]|nr:hypothetical protein [Elusimicrobiota bacterium]
MRLLAILALSGAFAAPAGSANAILCLYTGPGDPGKAPPNVYFDFAQISFNHELRGSGKARLSYRKMLPRNEAAEKGRFPKEGIFGYDAKQKRWTGFWQDSLGTAQMELKKPENPYVSQEVPDDAPRALFGRLILKYKKGGSLESWLFNCSVNDALTGDCRLYAPTLLDPTYNDESFHRRCQSPHRFEEMKWVHSPDGVPYYFSGVYSSQWDAREGYRLFSVAGGRDPDQHVSSTSICQDAQGAWRFLIQYHVYRLDCR